MMEWLSDTFLATSALLLLVLLIRTPVARYFGAGAAYFLWILPAARLFMPTLTQQVTLPALPAETGITQSMREATLAAIASGGEAAASTPAPGSIDWTIVSLSLWLGGAALLFIVQMFRYAAMREELLSDAAQIDQIGGIRIIQTDRVGGPLAFGLISRYVAVPRDFTRTFSTRERELALAHELAHHRRGDLFANMAAFLFLCLNWFNPLAWMAWSAFRFDQEAACDARVVSGADLRTRQAYGRAIARTATEGLPAFAMALNSPNTIIERLRRLMMNETSKGRRITGKLAILATAAIALPMTATVVPVLAEEKPAEPAETSKQKTRVLIIKGEDGQRHKIDFFDDSDMPFVKTVKKDGNMIVLHSNKELNEEQIETMVAEAEKSRAKTEAAIVQAAKAATDAGAPRIRSVKVISSRGFLAFAPETNFDEIAANCRVDGAEADEVGGSDRRNRLYFRSIVCSESKEPLEPQDSAKGASAMGPFSRQALVPMIPAKSGFPMTEETYKKLRAIAARSISEKALLEQTLDALRSARERVAAMKSGDERRNAEIIESLDREIGHLKSKIDRLESERERMKAQARSI